MSPDGAEASFEQRLSWLNLDRHGAARVAAEPCVVDSTDRPAWLEIAELVRERARHEPEPEPVDIAFGEYWWPWGTVARARLEDRLAATGCALPAAVLTELQRGLVIELASLGSSCLLSAFDEHRLPWQLGLDYSIARLSATPPRTLYQSFVRHLRAGPLVWERWPALIRLCATRVSFWVDSVSGFARRLVADRAVLSGAVGRELGPVLALNDRVSDSHNGGRRVFVVTFGDGVRVVYKPRSVRSELAFNEVVRWTNEHLPEGPGLRAYWVIDRDDYGWTDHVAPVPCPESEAATYYERAGMLLGLAYVLSGSDCHEDNVIAHGAHPVLVDLETFAGPQLLPSAPEDLEYAEAVRQIETESVLAIGMLPGWTWSPPGGPDNSGLLGDGRSRRLRFADLNTDLMRLVQTEEQPDAVRANRPRRPSGTVIEADRHVDSIVTGFDRVYALACRELDALLRPDGVLAPLRDGLARVVFRDTRQYAQVLAASLKPRALQDGFARSLAMESLCRVLIDLGPPDWAPTLLAEEQEALFRGDIPLLLASRRDGVVIARDPEFDLPRTIGTLHPGGAGARRLDDRLRRLGPDDLRLQRRCIESALISRAIRAEASVVPAPRSVGAGVEPRRFLDEAALGMARAVRDCSLLGPRGGRFWLGLEPETDGATARVGVLGPWLYSGQAGIALALAAAAAQSGDASLADAALSALAPLRELALADGAAAPLGAFDGLSGVIFALWHSARLLDRPALAEDARRLLGSIDRHAVERDRLFDVISGVAGLILAARCLEPVDGPRVHALIETSARHLVTHATRFEDGVGWPNWIEPKPLCGVAHGNSGIAWALMEAFRVTGDATFRQVALAAVSYERARRLESPEGTWPDLRKQPSNVAGWCHGPTGIALARCAMLGIEDSPELRADLALARASMEDRAATESRTHVCCGQTGIDDAMLEIGLRLRDATAIERAQHRASTRIRSLGDDANKWMHSSGVGDGVTTIPGLMKGSSGIILTLLRLSAPRAGTPCVLTLQP